MKIEYLHGSRFGNGAAVAKEFAARLAARGDVVDVRHIREVKPTELPAADLYVFSSPGQWGNPIRAVRRFLKRVELPAGTPYAILTTELAPKPDKDTGLLPSQAENDRWQRVIPVMREILHGKGLVEMAADKVYVTGLKGPLEEGWQQKVAAFADRISQDVRV